MTITSIQAVEAACLIKELVVDQRKVLQRWSKRTGQTAQLDSGYIAQHLISLLTGKRGSGFRGKGLDLDDGSEVKCAYSVDGVDIPRWNHNFISRKKVEEWLACPKIYYVLFDTETRDSSLVRVRIWSVTPSIDINYQTVLKNWADSSRKSNNFQLHPPVRRDGNLATNLCGDLELPLMFQADENENGEIVVKLYEENELPLCILYTNSSSKKGKRTDVEAENLTLSFDEAN